MNTKLKILTIVLAVCLFIIVFSIPSFAGAEKSPLRIICDCNFTGHLGITDQEGRLLVWKAPLKGDIDGFLLWWFDMPRPDPITSEDYDVGFYTARWEIFEDDPFPPDGSGGLISNPDAKLLLAGVSAGQTLTPYGQDAIWDGAGKVTEVSEEYRIWKGCFTYEGGPVVLSSFPYYGVGKFRINPHSYQPLELLNRPAAKNIEKQNISEGFKVFNNYPNPFNPSTKIDFALPNTSNVIITIHNSLGQMVRTVTFNSLSKGFHPFVWDGRNDHGQNMSSGLYVLNFNAKTMEGDTKTFSKSIKLLLVR